MASPSRELVLYARDRLLKDSNVSALVGNRIWYRAPEDATFPYIGDFETFQLRADATCVSGSDITLNIHVWTRDGQDLLQDARAIAHEIAQALHDFPLSLPSNHLVTLEHRGDRIFYDQDGKTGHGVVEFRAITQST